GPDVERPLVGLDGVEGGGEDLLEDVFRILTRGQHVAAERQQAGLVAADQRLEGVVVAAADQRDQPLVRLEPQERGAPVAGRDERRLEGGDFHAKVLWPRDTLAAPELRPAARASIGSGAR